jgi:hypothetical protein
MSRRPARCRSVVISDYPCVTVKHRVPTLVSGTQRARSSNPTTTLAAKAPLQFGYWQYVRVQWIWVTPVAVSVIGVAGSWLQVHRGRPHGRDLLKQDLKILKQLPEESTARQRLLEHIDNEVISLIESDEEKTRRPTGIVLAVAFLGLAIFLLVEAITRAGWWWWLVLPAAVIGIFGAVGLSQDAVRRKRDEKGNAV